METNATNVEMLGMLTENETMHCARWPVAAASSNSNPCYKKRCLYQMSPEECHQDAWRNKCHVAIVREKLVIAHQSGLYRILRGKKLSSIESFDRVSHLGVRRIDLLLGFFVIVIYLLAWNDNDGPERWNKRKQRDGKDGSNRPQLATPLTGFFLSNLNSSFAFFSQPRCLKLSSSFHFPILSSFDHWTCLPNNNAPTNLLLAAASLPVYFRFPIGIAHCWVVGSDLVR